MGVMGGVVVGVSLTAQGRTLVEAAAAEGEAFEAGDVAKIGQGISDKFAESNHVMLVRKGAVIYAMSAVCTHKGITIKVGADKQLRCPGHGSRFDAEGKVTKGPAEGQLARYGVEVKGGKLWVDPGKIFIAGDFEKEGAFVKVAPTSRPASRPTTKPATKPAK